MSTDYSEDRLIQKSAAELMETELAGLPFMHTTKRYWEKTVHLVVTVFMKYCLHNDSDLP